MGIQDLLAAQDLNASQYRSTTLPSVTTQVPPVTSSSPVTSSLPVTSQSAPPASSSSLLASPAPSGASARAPPVAMGTTEKNMSKSMTRVLQHSILQLCNEHIGYSHKLQILGVLCMTVDDEQQELVVKVNNTLKRVSPTPAAAAAGGTGMGPPTTTTPTMGLGAGGTAAQPVPPAAVAPVAPLHPAYPQYSADLSGGAEATPVQAMSRVDDVRTASPGQTPPSIREPELTQCDGGGGGNADSSKSLSGSATADGATGGSGCVASSGAGGRRSHGRKKNTPVKVQHVFDEGELISSDEDQDVLTVIPTDPDAAYDLEPSASVQQQQQQQRQTRSTEPEAESSHSLSHKTERPLGSAKRKAGYQYRVAHSNTAEGRDLSGGLSLSPSPALSHVPSHSHFPRSAGQSTVRALLMGNSCYGELSYATPRLPGEASSSSSPLSASLSLSPQDDSGAQDLSTRGSGGGGGRDLQSPAANPAGGASSSSSSASAPAAHRGLSLPVYVSPADGGVSGQLSPDDSEDDDRMDVDGTVDDSLDDDDDDDDSGGRLVIDMYQAGGMGMGLGMGVGVGAGGGGPKEEPGDDYSYSAGGHRGASHPPSSLSPSPSGHLNNHSAEAGAEDLSQHLALQNYTASAAAVVHRSLLANGTHFNRHEGLPTQVPYPVPFATSTPSKKYDGGGEGLTVKYTSTGPITVSANGKNVSHSSSSSSSSRMKVKDIILYDDTTPLNEQRGNRIETDYMLDAMGLEGRKRRRRANDETLTAEEIAEYLGSATTGGAVDRSALAVFKCKYCSDELATVTGYLQHTLSVHHAYICHQCGKSFTTKSSLLRHRPIHTGMRRFACSICKKTFYRKDKCKAHIKRHLGETGEQAQVERCDLNDTLDA